MENIDFATLFQGIGTMMASGWVLASARVFLVLLGLLLIYLGWKGILEPMVMIPMGLGMVAINCGTLIMPDGTLGNLFLDPMRVVPPVSTSAGIACPFLGRNGLSQQAA